MPMAKVTLVQMVYNGMRYIPQSFDSMVNQTFKDIAIVAVINGNDDQGKEYIQQHYPQVTIIDPAENLKFVKGHNLVFSQTDTEFFQLVNQDLILEPNYVEEMLKAFDDPTVGAANGKIYQYDFNTHQPLKKLDSTGVIIYKTGRARSRGQNEEDHGQYDQSLNLMAVDGAACMYRKSALESVRYPRNQLSTHNPQPATDFEYFDIDFDMYWEDVDLAWRLVNAGWQCRYVPTAIGYHGRTAASSPGGYKKVLSFIKHHNKFPLWIRQNNFKNHIFLFIKNSPKWYWQFFAREFFMLGYIMVFEIRTLKVLPLFFRQLPFMLKKRKFIQAHRKISISDMEHLFTSHPTELKK
jgi:GT2 family glycosyltransferase